jgi:uncharacterized membrane-anchored protein
MPFNIHRSFRASKVPNINGTFWFIKLLTTAMGEATSDFLVHRFNPELAVFGAGIIFVFVLWVQLRAPRFATVTYWAAVVMVSVFGTMCADVMHVGFGVPYVVSTTLFAIVLCAVFITWYRTEHTLSIHSILTTRRELFYWATITSTFALGTALGDMTATTLNLGYLKSGIFFAVIFCLPAIGYRVFKLSAIGTFWAAYVLTRPLGASFADYLGVSHARGGLNWGPGNVSMAFSVIIVIAVGVAARREHTERQALRRSSSQYR